MIDSVRSTAQSSLAAVKENSVLKEFKDFALRGNVIDLAIGIMVGGAFNTIVTSLVNDIVMPPIGLLIGKVDFSNLFINLSDKKIMSLSQAKAVGAATINYGLFINNVINFIIMAFVIFMIVRMINRLRRSTDGSAVPPQTKNCQFCCSTVPLQATRCAHCTSEI